MYKTKAFLVIPTIRNLDFLRSWGEAFSSCHLIIVGDRYGSEIDLPKAKFSSIKLVTRQDIDDEFGKDAWIFSRHNAGIRCYGFWKAYQAGADVVVTLDDDCFPAGDNLIKGHLDNLNFKIPLSWINTYPNPKWMFTRGMPYKNRNKIKVCLSHGLWSGALDLDGITEVRLKRLLNEQKYPPIRQLIPSGYFYPMCSMNMAFRREIMPLMFFPMMGEDPFGKKWPYDRFDDIWAGIFSKKIMDHLNLGVINGSPFVLHKKASKPKENYSKEINGLKINEMIWKLVNDVRLTKDNPKDCYMELASKIKFPETKYFKKLKEAMIIWANLF